MDGGITIRSPTLTFFCELEADALQALFADSSVIKDLVALEASVSLGILDLTPERAGVVHSLNEAGIPVIAWQLLPMEQGYWFNVSNAAQASARYGAFKGWSAEYGLQWAGIGVDIELDIRDLRQIMDDKLRLLSTLLRRLFNTERVRTAQAAYNALLTEMRVDGYRVDSYHLPLIIDERKAGSTLLQRVAGLVELRADREVLMLYTSILRPRGPGVLWSYGEDAHSVGVGITGGGVQVAGIGDVPPLNWDEFSRDLRLAYCHTNDIHVFSLEGCVQQGFLQQLNGFDWDQPITPPCASARQIERFRKGLRAILWASAHPLVVLAGLVGMVWLLSLLCPGEM
jgi:hypothetical protein